MATIPLVANTIRTPEQPDLLQNYARLMQLKNMQQQSQMQQQEAPLRMQALQNQVQSGQLENAARQQQMNDANILRTFSPQFVTKDADGKVTGYDVDGFLNKALTAGVSPQTVSALQKGFTEGATAKANLTKTQLENENALTTQAFNHLEGLRGTQTPLQRQQMWVSTITPWVRQNAAALKIDPSQIPLQAPDDGALSGLEAGLGMRAQQLADAASKAKTSKDAAQARENEANADASIVKQYAPVLSQATDQQDYSKKLQAFETLHPDLTGRFPQQFDSKNPMAVLNVGMSPADIAQVQQKERLTKYQEAQANYRAQLGRQTTFDNSRMLHGLNQIDDYTANPQHGYGQFLSQVGAVKSAIQSARDGNQLAASLEPMMLALGVSSFAGVHRINDTEINRAGSAAGSAFRKLDNLLNQVGTGKPSAAQLKEAGDIIDQLSAARHNAYLQGVSAIAANTKLDPSSVMVFDQSGNIAPLSTVKGGKGMTALPPRGATMKVPGSDGQLHWSDGKNDLGVVQ